MPSSGCYKNKQQQEEDENQRRKGLVAAVAVVGFAAYCVGSFFSTKQEEDENQKLKGLVAAVAVVGFAGYCVRSFFSTKEEEKEPKKTMTAPGWLGTRINRGDFEENPSAYFRGVRINKQRQEEDENRQLKGLVAAGAAAVAAAGFAAYCVGSFSSTKEQENEPKKTMIAPGRPGTRINRGDFEENPSEYFRGVRKNKQQQVEDENQQLKGLVASEAAAVAVADFAAYCVGSFSSTKEQEKEPKKTMTAPGRPGTRINRGDFEENPSEYFRGVRKNKQQQEEDENQQLKGLVASEAAAVAVADFAAYCVGSFFSTKEEEKEPKKMAAPGRPGTRIIRGDFEKNPSQYFRDLHKK